MEHQRVDDRQHLPRGFTLDDGVDIVAPRAGDRLCLAYEAKGKGGRPLKVREYFPADLATRGGDQVIRPRSEAEREIYDAGLQSFIAFCERLAAIEHRAVEPLLGLIEGYGSAYLVLDQPRAVELGAWLDGLGRPANAAEIESIADGLCEGLAVAHAADLLHLDLGPDTVFVHGNAQPLLVDFAATAIGLAASAGRAMPPAKLGYAPPEREAGDLVHMGPGSDVYAVAAILFRLVTGQAPPGAGLRRAGDTVAAKLKNARIKVSQAMLVGIARGLALDPAERPASAAAFHALLKAPAETFAAPADVFVGSADASSPEAVRRAEVGKPVASPAAATAQRPWYTRPIGITMLGLVFMIAGALSYNIVGISWNDDPPAIVEPAVKIGTTTTTAAHDTTATPKSGSPSAPRLPDADSPLDRTAETGLKPGDRFRECPGCPEMVTIPSGGFTMGSSSSERGHEPDEAPLRKVEIKAGLSMSRTAVTRAEFELFVAASGYQATFACRVFEGSRWVERYDLSFRNPGFRQDGDHPVVCVNWNDARAFAEWLSKKTGKRYRLPSEAEWEYAARAGTTTPFWWGSEISTRQANYDGTSVYGSGQQGENRQATVRALFFEPNPWGLYQVHGNVSQWVEDCWNPTYRGAPTDGAAWVSGDCTRRVLRGGSWGYAPKDVRAAYREGATTEFRNYTFGFRVVRELN